MIGPSPANVQVRFQSVCEGSASINAPHGCLIGTLGHEAYLAACHPAHAGQPVRTAVHTLFHRPFHRPPPLTPCSHTAAVFARLRHLAQAAIFKAYTQTNQDIGNRVSMASEAGSCAVTFTLTRAAGVLHLFVANAGDCRAVLYTGARGASVPAVWTQAAISVGAVWKQVVSSGAHCVSGGGSDRQ